MNNSHISSQRASQTRLIVAISLFAAALVSAVALTALGNRSDSYWVATHSLIPGTQIQSSDIKQVQVALGDTSSQYLSGASSAVSSFVTRIVSEGELISFSAVSDTPPELRSQQVPLALRSVDIPGDIELGEAITIFWVPEVIGLEAIVNPELVLTGAFLRSIDRKGSNFGSNVAVTVSVYNRQIISLLKSTVTGRLVVVRSQD